MEKWYETKNELLRAALRALTAERSEPHAFADAEQEYALDVLALAARDFAAAVDALPANEQPPGWRP